MNWIKKIFSKNRNKSFTQDVRCKTNDDNNFADVYINDKKTNVKLLMFNKEDVKRLQNIAEKIYQKQK